MRALLHIGEDTTDTTLDGFLEANTFEPEEVEDIRAALARGATYYGGGGAAPVWSLEPFLADFGYGPGVDPEAGLNAARL